MLDLTFAEQVKIVLNRKGMTIKQLAELIEAQTGKKMSRQNLTQRLNRDNFQEQDMRMIAKILECPFQLSILGEEDSEANALAREKQGSSGEDNLDAGLLTASAEDSATGSAVEIVRDPERGGDITVGEFLDIEEIASKDGAPSIEELLAEVDAIEQENKEHMIAKERKKGQQEALENEKKQGNWKSRLHLGKREPERPKEEENPATKETEEMAGEINPYTGKEYASNSVRMHPSRIGYVQVYNRKNHKWTDMTEWAFLGYQERRKALLGKNYEPPSYLD